VKLNNNSQVLKIFEVKMKPLAMFLILLSYLFATEWSLLGPSDAKVYDYAGIPEHVLGTENGLYIDSADAWKNYSNGLPILDVYQLNTDTLLLVMSNGSWSDGLYAFNLKTKTFDVVYYCGFPSFIYYEPIVPTFFLGTLQGCFISDDGRSWTEIAALHSLECYSMVSYEGEMAITTSDGIYWHAVYLSYPFQKSEGSPVLTELANDYNGHFWGVLPGSSKSAGVWISNDFGKTWVKEFYEENLSAIFWNGNLLVGWESANYTHQGVAKWDSLNKQLNFINNGLPAAKINRFSTNELMNCVNVICCTDSGAYFTCNIMQSEINNVSRFLPQEFKLIQNYPNPFNPETTIRFELPRNFHITLEIYNLLGQKIVTLFNGNKATGSYSLKWDGKDQKGNDVASGIYFYKLVADDFSQIKKMVLTR
jgi:hypothetical protein